MKIHRVRWKNFLSTGNAFTELEMKPGLTLIVGTNGAGKSSIADAICFALFGVPFRKINKPQLINTINKKDCLVEIEFEEGGDEFLVRRGLKPSVFEIYRNDELVNQDSTTKDYQVEFEKTVLKRNFKSFSQIEILGSRSFVPFMALPAGHRRTIVEDILDLQVFSVMAQIIKDEASEIESSIASLELEKHKVQVTMDYKRKMAAEVERRNKSQARDFEDEVAKIEDLIYSQDILIQELESKISSREKDLDGMEKNERNRVSAREVYSVLNRDYQLTEKDAKFFNHNNVCPTCTQEIDDAFRTAKIATASEEMSIIEGKIELLRERMELYEERHKEFSKVQADLSKLKSDLSSATSVRQTLGKNLRDLNDRIQKSSVDAFQESSEDYDTEDEELKVLEISKNMDKLLSRSKVLKVAAKMLKDDGIKAEVISRDIPLINEYINKYLEAFDFFVEFVLDETFSEKILSRYRDEFSYHSFSEGEKARIDLAIMLAWRDIARLRTTNSSNLLILDEVLDGSLNVEGREALLKLLLESKDFCTIVISHNAENVGSVFDRTISFKKIKNFSEMEIEE